MFCNKASIKIQWVHVSHICWPHPPVGSRGPYMLAICISGIMWATYVAHMHQWGHMSHICWPYAPMGSCEPHMSTICTSGVIWATHVGHLHQWDHVSHTCWPNAPVGHVSHTCWPYAPVGSCGAHMLAICTSGVMRGTYVSHMHQWGHVGHICWPYAPVGSCGAHILAIYTFWKNEVENRLDGLYQYRWLISSLRYKQMTMQHWNETLTIKVWGSFQIALVIQHPYPSVHWKVTCCTTRSRKIFKPLDFGLWLASRSEIWQARIKFHFFTRSFNTQSQSNWLL